MEVNMKSSIDTTESIVKNRAAMVWVTSLLYEHVQKDKKNNEQVQYTLLFYKTN